MYNRLPTLIPYKYVVEVRSFALNGDVSRTYEIKGYTDEDMIKQFESLRLAEREVGFELVLPLSLYEMFSAL